MESPVACSSKSTFFAYDETAEVLLRRMYAKPLNTGLKIFEHEIPQGLRAGVTVGLCGPPGSGKTMLLLDVIVTCLLPGKWHEFDIGGEERGVILYDNDYHFYPYRLSSMIKNRVLKLFTAGGNQFCESFDAEKFDMDAFLKSCLQRLFIIQCLDSFQFLISLKNIPKLLLEVPNATVLVVDSISAFYWLDRGDDECGRIRQRLIFKTLSDLVTNYELIFLAAETTLFKDRNTRYSHRDYLSLLWNDLLRFRFLVEREVITSDNYEYLHSTSRSEVGNSSFSTDLPEKTLIQFVVRKIFPETNSTSYPFVVSSGGIRFL